MKGGEGPAPGTTAGPGRLRAWGPRGFRLERRRGKVGPAIGGMPLVMLPLERPRRFVEAVESGAPGRGFLLYTNRITSPLPYRKLGLTARREAWTPLNFPPASVWRYLPTR